LCAAALYYAHHPQARFPLPTLGPYFLSLREEILHGRGFILLRNLPVRQWGNAKSATAYMGIGTYFGYFVSQNARGHVLGHVKDLGEDPTKTDKVRIYRTRAKQFFHTDGADLVGLLCMSNALNGGESDIASTHEVFNTLQKEHPEAVRTLVESNWYFDRKGEVSQGDQPWYTSSVFWQEKSESGAAPRVGLRFDPNNVTSLKRYNSGPSAQIPPLSDAQLDAMRLLDETAARLALHMVLEPGDIQLLANTHVLHARTAYRDWPEGSVDELGNPRIRRHLMRLWLATPSTEGGWRTPYADVEEKKRGGIQVDYNPPTCPLDAE